MSARLDALRNDDIAADRGSLERFFARTNLPGGQRTLIVDHPYKLGIRLGVEALDNPAHLRGLLKVRPHLRARVMTRNEVHPEGAVGEVSRPTEEAGEGVGIHSRSRGSDHAQPTGFGNRTRKLRRRGCSQPRLLNRH
jgi:hypothetical protein